MNLNRPAWLIDARLAILREWEAAGHKPARGDYTRLARGAGKTPSMTVMIATYNEHYMRGTGIPFKFPAFRFPDLTKPPGPKKSLRKCLGLWCGGEMFSSRGPGNRMCDRCISNSNHQGSAML